MILCKDLDPTLRINTLEDWLIKCPPAKGEDHWRDGRSAKELAKDWITHKGCNLLSALNKYKEFNGIIFEKGSPELETRFDSFNNGRKHDFLLVGTRGEEKIVIAIETKVNESFGNDTVESYYMKSILKKMNSENTNVPKRIEDLITAIFKSPYSKLISSLQYQLLHAIAGTIAEAQKQNAVKAIFLVQTYKTPQINKKRYEGNQTELNKLITILSSGTVNAVEEGQIYGPFYANGNTYISPSIPLYIGKITT